ncbi:MAG TPA: YggT family protein [Leucothrix sp.]|nr:YggT family protein [Leucothrix sp.]
MGLGTEILVFLVDVIFSLYISAVVIRLLLGFARADFRNPMSQFLVKVTNPALVPLRRFLPSFGSIDSSAVFLAFVLTLIKLTLIMLIKTGALHFPEIIIYAVGDLVKLIIYLYLFSLIIQVITSWIGSAQGNPITPLLNSLTAPILRPIRKVVPLIGMMDLSPLVAILGLNILLMIVARVFI